LIGNLTLTNTLLIFIIGDLTELFVCIFLSRRLLQRPFRVQWNRHKQVLLLKESLPQTGVVFFTAIMSRLDWILVGLLISSARLAEYSFAYKIFEVCTLPLLIIAPIMIPMFTRLQKRSENTGKLIFFLEWQIIVASLVVLLLNVCWTPLIDFVTDGKYGMVNSRTIFILSFSMPLLYFSNYLWTIQFTKGNLKLVFTVMAVSFIVNLVACSVLIPLYKNEGAAIAYFLTVLVQLVLYIQKKTLPLSANRWYILFLWPVTAAIAGFISYRFTTGLFARFSTALFIYLGIIFITRQLRVKDWKTLQSLYQ
jgi:O-antigen/teichoic acid export membrane protein